MKLPIHLMVLAELRKVVSRPGAWLAAGLSCLVPLAVWGILLAVQPDATDPSFSADLNGQLVAQMIPNEVKPVLAVTLEVRNLIVLPMILLMITAQLFAGEWDARTLRSLLWRPIPRWSVLTSKFLALMLFSGVMLLLTYLLALLPSLASFESNESLKGVTIAYLVSWGRDGLVITLGMLASTIAPSVVGVVVGTLIFLVSEWLVRWGFQGAEAVGLIDWGNSVAQWMPGAAWDSWQGYRADDWSTENLIAMGALFVVCIGAALWRFQRMDVP